jgi:hypothetical protein
VCVMVLSAPKTKSSIRFNCTTFRDSGNDFVSKVGSP